MCILKKETRVDNRQKLYVNTYVTLLQLAVRHFSRNVRAFMECFDGEELVSRPHGNFGKSEIPSNGENYQMCGVHGFKNLRQKQVAKYKNVK